MDVTKNLDLRSRIQDEDSFRFRPKDIAVIGGVDVSTVHFYEREGMIPAASRRRSGHRRYASIHCDAMRTARTVIAGYGWQQALRTMRALHAGDVDAVNDIVDGRHGAIDRERRDIRSLVMLLERMMMTTHVDERSTRTSMRIGEAARWLGVTVATLRHWEREGLIVPDRDPDNAWRVFDRRALERLRVIATLRLAGYGVPDVRAVLADLGKGKPESALVRVRKRLDDLRLASERCMEATAAVLAYRRALLELDSRTPGSDRYEHDDADGQEDEEDNEQSGPDTSVVQRHQGRFPA